MRAGPLAALVAALLLAAPAGAQREAPRARAGAIDLTGWDFARDGIVDLAGEWDFAWRRFEDPAAPRAAGPGAYTQVPAAWNAGAAPEAFGYATYRLRVDCKAGERLALVLPLQHSAARFYVNGRLVAEQGRPGVTAEAARPSYVQQIAPLEGAACPLEVVAHASNYDMRQGGLLRSVELGTERQVLARREHGLARDLFALGGVLVLSLLPILFWLWRREDRAPLWVGMYGLSSAAFLAIGGERFAQPWIAPLGWDAAWRLVLVPMMLGLAAFPSFLRALYPAQFPRALHRAFAGAAALIALLVLATPARIYTQAVPAVYALALAVAGWSFVVLARAALSGRRDAWLLFAGTGVLVACGAHDTLLFSHQLSSKLTPWGLLAFSLAPAILLARRFARALRAEEASALEQRQQVDLLVNATKAGIFDTDVAARRSSYSARLKEMLGHAPGADSAGWPPFIELVHPEDRARIQASFAANMRDLSVKNGVRRWADSPDFRVRRADGGYLWIHGEAISVTGADGRTLRHICSFLDISERKQQELELADRSKFINDLFDSVPLALTLRDAEGRYLVVNRKWEEYFGVARGEIVGKTVRERASERMAGAVLALDREVLARGPGAMLQQNDFEYRGRRYSQTRSVMADAQGKVLGVLVASIDTTERHAIEISLAAERQRLALVIEATQAGMIDWDTRTESPWYSDRFKEMLGYPLDVDTSAWASVFGSLMHPEDRDRSREVFFKGLVDAGAPGSVVLQEPLELRLRRADGSWLWVQSMGLTQRDERGEVRRYLAAVTDISARRAQEEALRNRVKFINDLFESVPVQLAMRDPQGRYLFVNRVWEQSTGYPRDAVIGQTPHAIRGAAEAGALLEMDRAAFERDAAQPGASLPPQERRIEDRSFLQTRSVVRDADGRVLGVVVASIDTTERVAMEERLREQVALTHAIVSQAPNAIFAKDRDGRFTLANRGWSQMSGIPAERALGRTVYDLYPADAARRFAEEDARLVAQGADAPLMEALHRGPGPDQYRIVRKAVLSRGEEVLGLVCSSTDVTEIKRIEQALAREQERLQLLVRATKAGFMDWDATADTRVYSERFREMLGYPRDADTSQWPPLFEMMHPDDREKMRDAFRGMLREGAATGERMHGPLEYRLRKADGSYLWVRGEGIAQIGADGRTERFLTSYIDITPLRELNLALAESVRLREEVDRLGRHDLKTPLSSIIGFSRVLRESGRLGAEDDRLLGFVEQAGYRLLGMINLSLDMLRMEQGSYPFQPRAVDVLETLGKVARDLQALCDSRRVSIAIEGPRLGARAEELLCYSMLANLVKNAVEAAPAGGAVRIGVEDAGADELRISIHNAGVVPEALRLRFFHKYASSGKSGGTGLGNYSARLMARTQQGNIAMRSAAAEGTTVTVTLRTASESDRAATERARAGQAPEAAAPISLAAARAISVLVVDDDDYSRVYIRSLLPAAATVAEAANGREALQRAAAAPPELILMDLDMPVMGGLEAAARWREREQAGGGGRLAMIAMSSHDGAEIRQRALAAGFDLYLEKPVSPDALRRAIAALLGAPGPADPVPLQAKLRQALPGFLESRRELLRQLERAIAAGESEAARALAHKLAGGFALYGFRWAAGQGKLIEMRAGEGALDGLAAVVAALHEHLDAVRVEVLE